LFVISGIAGKGSLKEAVSQYAFRLRCRFSTTSSRKKITLKALHTDQASHNSAFTAVQNEILLFTTIKNR
jgi:hypothetical protein